MESDLHMPEAASLMLVLLAPLALVFAGLDTFAQAIALAGGVFLSVQYALIAYVSRKILRAEGWRRVGLDLVALAFAAAALYEIYIFVVG
jgi:hypothetical protein